MPVIIAVTVWVPAMIIAHQVLDTGPVAAFECFPICAAVTVRNVRVTELVAVIDVRRTMVLRVLISASYAIAEALLLHGLILRWWSGPGFIRVIALLRWPVCLEGRYGCDWSPG